MESTVKLYAPGYAEGKTYLLAVLFVLGNIILPQLCHLMPHGGLIWLPIYFFTLVGAYKYGWRVGLLTALCSPTVNSLLFGMPVPAVLPAILLKSTILALVAGWTAAHLQRVSIPVLLGVVIAYQVLGTLGEWAMVGDFMTAVQDFRLGIPGMFLQVLGGYAVIKYLIYK